MKENVNLIAMRYYWPFFLINVFIGVDVCKMLTCLGSTAQSYVEDAVYLNKPNRTLQKYNKSKILLLQNFFMCGLFQVM
jgi:hypothetical protein